MKNYIYIILTAISFSITITSCKNKYSKEIEKSCSDCSETKIRKSDFILVTNKNGESNVFSKSRMSFVLSHWYEATYDEGTFYDDITFKIDGRKKIVMDINYDFLRDHGDNYLLGKILTDREKQDSQNSKFNNQEEARKNGSTWRVCHNCTGRSCTKCFGRGYYYGKESY